MNAPFKHPAASSPRPQYQTAHSIDWSDERNIEALREMWINEELSTSQIAAALGDPSAKNAVIGKAHRLGLPPRRAAYSGVKRVALPAPKVRPPRTNSGAEPRKGRSGMSSRPLLQPIESEPVNLDPGAPAPGSRMLGYFDAGLNDCKWLYGDPRDIWSVLVCAAPAVEESSWCSFHSALCRPHPNGHFGDERPDLAAKNRRAGPSPIVLAVLSDREERAA